MATKRGGGAGGGAVVLPPQLASRSSSSSGGGGGMHQQHQQPFHVAGVAAGIPFPLSHNHHHPHPSVAGGGGTYVVGGIPKLPPHAATFIAGENQSAAASSGAVGPAAQELSPRGKHVYPPARPLLCTTIVAWLALIFSFVMAIMVAILYFNWSGGPLTAATVTKNNAANKNLLESLQAQIRAMNRRQRLHEQTHYKKSRKAAGRIIGGTPVDPTFATGPRIKYQVGIEADVGGVIHRCGGSIIGPNHVLTAAHCIYDLTTHTAYLPSNLTIIPGTDFSDRTLAVRGHSTFVHPTYVGGQPAPNRQDIAVIRVNHSFTFTSSVAPVQLAAASSCTNTGCKGTGTTYVASGYGFTVSNEEGGADLSDILLYVDLQFVEDETCAQRAVENGRDAVALGAICAGPVGNITSGKDTCQGDSGGPLVHVAGISYLQVAVVSTGTAVTNPLCGGTGDYGEYAGVVYNRNWIDLAVAGNIVPTRVSSGAAATLVAAWAFLVTVMSLSLLV